MSKYRKDFKDEQGYVGNIWGWKFSLFSLILILVMLSVMGIRYCYLEQSSQEDTTEIMPEK